MAPLGRVAFCHSFFVYQVPFLNFSHPYLCSVRKLFFPFLLLSFSLQAQLTAEEAFKGALSYLIETQTDSTIEGKQYEGEWPVFMELTEPYFFIGRRQRARDSNCFTVSAIYNQLAQIYLRDSSLTYLKPVLVKAFEEIQTYGTGTEFNFWKALPPLKDHRFRFRKADELPLVRRPTNFHVKPRLVQKMSNVANDADDTNQANLAIWYHNLIFQDTLKLVSASKFESRIDLNRQNRNWYNYLFHTRKNSGAYLTWFADEHDYGVWNPVYSYLSVLSTFLPTSSAYPKAYKPWIPWGANEVCPIVNANILTYLAKSNQLKDAFAVANSSEMIHRMTRKSMWHTAGVYYPNAQHLSYSVAKAYASGVHHLEEAAKDTRDYIQNTQREDGSFLSKPWINYGDTIQTTTYALSAMLNLEKAGLEIDRKAIRKTVDFLLSKAIEDENGIHWKGGVYFTGGTALRNILHWESDAYTTSLIAESLQRILLSPEKKD